MAGLQEGFKCPEKTQTRLVHFFPWQRPRENDSHKHALEFRPRRQVESFALGSLGEWGLWTMQCRSTQRTAKALVDWPE